MKWINKRILDQTGFSIKISPVIWKTFKSYTYVNNAILRNREGDQITLTWQWIRPPDPGKRTLFTIRNRNVICFNQNHHSSFGKKNPVKNFSHKEQFIRANIYLWKVIIKTFISAQLSKWYSFRFSVIGKETGLPISAISIALYFSPDKLLQRFLMICFMSLSNIAAFYND